MNELKNNQIKRDAIAERTKKQSESGVWKRLRSKMLTASNFGRVCSRQKTTLTEKLVKGILLNKFVIDAMEYGTYHEEDARQQLSKKLGIKVEKCGFFIDPEIKFLGCSPAGLIAEELYYKDISLNAIMNRKCNEFSYEVVAGGIVEIKCPYSAKNMKIQEAKENISNIKKWFLKDLKFLKTSHEYYYQIQGQLHCTRRKYCIFVIWTLCDMEMTAILRDDKLWDAKVNKLTEFYLHCLLPEIIDSRHLRGFPPREPQFVLDAREPYIAIQKEKKEKKFNAILQKCIEAEKEKANIESTLKTSPALNPSQPSLKRKADFKNCMQTTVKK